MKRCLRDYDLRIHRRVVLFFALLGVRFLRIAWRQAKGEEVTFDRKIVINISLAIPFIGLKPIEFGLGYVRKVSGVRMDPSCMSAIADSCQF